MPFWAAGAALVLGGTALRLAAQEAPPPVLANGRITTLDPPAPEAPAIAMGDGPVLAAGDLPEVQAAAPGAEEIDLGGRRVVPG